MIEIQLHPSDIRRKVRYFFFDRRTFAVAIVASVIVLSIVIGSMAAAPSVIRRAYKENFLREMKHEREVQAERLKAHVDQMAMLEQMLDQHRVMVEKLIAVYNLSEGQLGYGGLSYPGPVDTMNIDLADAHRRELHLKKSIAKLQQQIDLLSRYEAANNELVRHIPSILPIPDDQFVLTSPFGGRLHPFTRTQDFHGGLDLAAPKGTSIFATADGVVTFAGRVSLRQSVNWWRYGNVVVVSHAERFLTIYAHCDTVNVKPGMRVKQGDVVATVGSTGWSTNSHLHYEIRGDVESPGDFQPIDPRIYILDYQWNNEEKLLIRSRRSNDYTQFDPLPPAFIGRRRA